MASVMHQLNFQAKTNGMSHNNCLLMKISISHQNSADGVQVLMHAVLMYDQFLQETYLQSRVDGSGDF